MKESLIKNIVFGINVDDVVIINNFGLLDTDRLFKYYKKSTFYEYHDIAKKAVSLESVEEATYKYVVNLNNERVNVQITFDNYDITSTTCDCNDYKNGNKYCKHTCMCAIYTYSVFNNNIYKNIFEKIGDRFFNLINTANKILTKNLKYLKKNQISYHKNKYLEMIKGYDHYTNDLFMEYSFKFWNTILFGFNPTVALLLKTKQVIIHIDHNRRLLKKINKILKEADLIFDELDSITDAKTKDFISINNENSYYTKIVMDIIYCDYLYLLSTHFETRDFYRSKILWRTIFSLNNANFENDCLVISEKLTYYIKEFEPYINYQDDYVHIPNSKEVDKLRDLREDIININDYNHSNRVANNSFLFDVSDKDNKDDELEKEMDFYGLDEEEKEAVRSGDFEPWNFNLPGDEELDEEDYYYEDDNLL